MWLSLIPEVFRVRLSAQVVLCPGSEQEAPLPPGPGPGGHGEVWPGGPGFVRGLRVLGRGSCRDID